MSLTLTAGNVATILVLMGILVRIHLFANRIERRFCEHDEMWLEHCMRHGYPVTQRMLDRFRRVNGEERRIL